MPRNKPYSEIGIKRLRCFRCGRKACHQWQICALNNLWHPICVSCDIELNDLVLRWMGVVDADKKIQNYIERNR